MSFELGPGTVRLPTVTREVEISGLVVPLLRQAAPSQRLDRIRPGRAARKPPTLRDVEAATLFAQLSAPGARTGRRA
jgi:hypothetical protein